jgi:hypothetical protein
MEIFICFDINTERYFYGHPRIAHPIDSPLSVKDVRHFCGCMESGITFLYNNDFFHVSVKLTDIFDVHMESQLNTILLLEICLFML